MAACEHASGADDVILSYPAGGIFLAPAPIGAGDLAVYRHGRFLSHYRGAGWLYVWSVAHPRRTRSEASLSHAQIRTRSRRKQPSDHPQGVDAWGNPGRDRLGAGA